MSENFPLNFIYSYKTVNVLNGEEENPDGQNFACYQIIYFFSESDKVHFEKLREIYEGSVGKGFFGEKSIGPFDNLGDLNNFVLKVCTELGAPHAFLLSVNDYNLGLSTVTSTRHFRNIFPNYGKKLVNPAFRSEKSSFFKRIFKDS